VFNFPTILGCVALLLLLGGIASSAKLLYAPASQRLDRSLACNPAAERSSILLLGSLALSLVAACLAVVWLFLP
jgi:hypothetical protein